jgi:hypothetical protein
MKTALFVWDVLFVYTLVNFTMNWLRVLQCGAFYQVVGQCMI